MSSADNSLKRPLNIPSNPGIYTFLDGREKPVYIGKAANLKKRLNSYWRKNVGAKVSQLLGEAAKVRWIIAESEIDALLKEAELIKQYHPKYNILMRDDKNYFYVGITKEEFPRIFLTHQPAQQMANSKWQIARRAGSKKLFAIRHKPLAEYIGPFTSGGALKIVLRLLRRLFPYCTCEKPHKRPCLNSQIGRCPGFCCLKSSLQHSNILQNVRMSVAAKRAYAKNIRNIINVLAGRKKNLFKKLKKEMRQAAKLREFERAATLRDQMRGIENIFGHRQSLEVRLPFGSRTSPGLTWNKTEKNIRTILGINKKISRVEGYDISNISGTAATGSMVVFIEGISEKSEYRKFKIKTVHQISDVDMLKEVIGRRLAHKEWQYPDLMLIDGGKPQLNAATAAFAEIRRQYADSRRNFQRKSASSQRGSAAAIAIAALAKREEELYIEGQAKPILLSTLPAEVAFFFQRVRDESHRFAKSYHHKLREKQL